MPDNLVHIDVGSGDIVKLRNGVYMLSLTSLVENRKSRRAIGIQLCRKGQTSGAKVVGITTISVFGDVYLIDPRMVTHFKTVDVQSVVSHCPDGVLSNTTVCLRNLLGLTPELSAEEICTYMLQVISSIMKDKLEGGSSFNKEYVTGKIRVVREYIDNSTGKVQGVEIWERVDSTDAQKTMKDMWENKVMDNRTKAILEDFHKRHPNARMLENMPEDSDALGTISEDEADTPIEPQTAIEPQTSLDPPAVETVEVVNKRVSAASEPFNEDLGLGQEETDEQGVSEETIEGMDEEPDSYISPRVEQEASEPTIEDLMAIEAEGAVKKPRVIVKPPEFTRPVRGQRMSTEVDMGNLEETTEIPKANSAKTDKSTSDEVVEEADTSTKTVTSGVDRRKTKPYVPRKIAESSHPYAKYVNYEPDFEEIKGRIDAQPIHTMLYAYFDYCVLGGVNFARRWHTAYPTAYQKFNMLKKWISGFSDAMQEEYEKVKEAYLSVYGDVVEK